VFAEPPWPADMQVHVLAEERIGPVLSPHFAGFERCKRAGRPCWRSRAAHHLAPAGLADLGGAAGPGAEALNYGQAFEHLYYLLEAAVAGLGVAIAPQPLVAEDLKAGRWLHRGAFHPPGGLALWVPRRAADGRAEQLAQWLRQELQRQAG
jgi:DNA-binding transcriptional LysR family regulator